MERHAIRGSIPTQPHPHQPAIGGAGFGHDLSRGQCMPVRIEPFFLVLDRVLPFNPMATGPTCAGFLAASDRQHDLPDVPTAFQPCVRTCRIGQIKGAVHHWFHLACLN